MPLTDLAAADLIVHSADRRSVMYGVVLVLLRDAGVEPHIRHQVGETSPPVTLVAGGLGVAVVPEPVTTLALDGVVHLPPAGAGARVEPAVAHRADRSEPGGLVRERSGCGPWCGDGWRRARHSPRNARALAVSVPASGPWSVAKRTGSPWAMSNG